MQPFGQQRVRRPTRIDNLKGLRLDQDHRDLCKRTDGGPKPIDGAKARAVNRDAHLNDWILIKRQVVFGCGLPGLGGGGQGLGLRGTGLDRDGAQLAQQFRCTLPVGAGAIISHLGKPLLAGRRWSCERIAGDSTTADGDVRFSRLARGEVAAFRWSAAL
ncbi:hypothetical protein EJ903_00065 [Azospirillum griseum]|uniref:Uncharacterized protein n=1 Tax=Azospirillum griseum TaxID=2496639 RepID=A0A3S0RBZ6_9PROT|nr:hypothetical protein EJ903_00065 [Azospirillum griseum]